MATPKKTGHYEKIIYLGLENSKNLLNLTMPDHTDLHQLILAGLMVLFVLSSMSLVWTFSVIVPYLRGSTYTRSECRLIGIQGVPELCWKHDFFKEITFDSSSKVHLTSFYL